MTTELESMALEMPEVEGHPNRVAFRGVLTVVDVPSERAPSVSGGKRVLLTKKAAEAAIPSLIGMAVDYAPSLDRHDARRKVGGITSADVVGRNLEVSGYLYAKDFPEIVDEIGRLGRRPAIGNRTSDLGPQASGVGLQASGETLAGEGEKRKESLAGAVTEIQRLIESARTGSGQKKQLMVLRTETPLVL